MFKELASKCLGCANPTCESACPLHNHIKDFIKEIKNDNIIKAREILDETSPFPYICSTICDFKRQCFGNCIRNRMNDPVYVYEIEKELSKIEMKYDIKESKNIKIAVIGSGISGLSIAKLLVIDGYKVDVFEKENFIGGTIKTGIPSYRLDEELINRMIIEVKDLGVNFILNKKYPEDISIETLKNDGYDKIILALGAMKSNSMNIPNKEYSVDGLSLLYDLNINHNHDLYKNYKNIYVVGGGNVAMDCARSLVRINDNVTIIYRRTIDQMPANDDEIKEAMDEGVNFLELRNPSEIIIEDNKVKSFVAQKMCLGEIDESGRASFKLVEGEDEEYTCDLLVMAIGQKVDIEDNDIALTKWGTVLVNDHFKTSISNVYAIGDCVSGPSNVARAIKDAKDLYEIEFKGE